jgi:hypothetical protein
MVVESVRSVGVIVSALVTICVLPTTVGDGGTMTGGIPTLWLDAERIGEHTHVRVRMGTAYGQDEKPHYRREEADHANDAGDAGRLIFRPDEWEPYIHALAAGGYATGLRVIWTCPPDDPRKLWNGAPDTPCVVDSLKPVPWVFDREEAMAAMW